MKTIVFVFWGAWSVLAVGMPLLQISAPSSADVWQTLIRSIPNIVAFIVLVVIFIRHIEARERSQDELIRNNTRIIEKNTEVVGGAINVMERTERERVHRLENIRIRKGDGL